MRRTLVGLIVIAVVLLGRVHLFGHHSFAAEFDDKKPITIKGTLTKVELTNPHGWLYMNVKDQDGKIYNWAVETGAPLALIRRGGDRKSLAVGTEIIVEGRLARDGSKTVNGRTIKFGDGRELLAGTSNTSAPYIEHHRTDRTRLWMLVHVSVENGCGALWAAALFKYERICKCESNGFINP